VGTPTVRAQEAAAGRVPRAAPRRATPGQHVGSTDPRRAPPQRRRARQAPGAVATGRQHRPAPQPAGSLARGTSSRALRAPREPGARGAAHAPGKGWKPGAEGTAVFKGAAQRRERRAPLPVNWPVQNARTGPAHASACFRYKLRRTAILACLNRPKSAGRERVREGVGATRPPPPAHTTTYRHPPRPERKTRRAGGQARSARSKNSSPARPCPGSPARGGAVACAREGGGRGGVGGRRRSSVIITTRGVCEEGRRRRRRRRIRKSKI